MRAKRAERASARRFSFLAAAARAAADAARGRRRLNDLILPTTNGEARNLHNWPRKVKTKVKESPSDAFRYLAGPRAAYCVPS